MTKALFLISAFLFMNQPAQAQEERSEMGAQICVHSLIKEYKVSREEALEKCTALSKYASEKEALHEKASEADEANARMKDHFDALNEEGAND